MEAYKIIIEPVLTEKTNRLKESDEKKYAFRVHMNANKVQVMEAVKELFSVHPTACNIVNVKPKFKLKRTKGGSQLGKLSGWKKAIVTLVKGEKIDKFEGA
jgi:large subunit ribosomal protein L23